MSVVLGSGEHRYRVVESWAKLPDGWNLTDVAAKNSDFLSYANGNLASQKLVDPKILNDRNIYPDEAMQKKLFVIQARDPATQRIINRLWTRVKTGK